MRNIIKKIIESSKTKPSGQKFKPAVKIKRGSCCGGKIK
jgi:hypothetical protein